jgi:hypothetical protein
MMERAVMESCMVGCLLMTNCSNTLGFLGTSEVVGRNEGSQALHGYSLCRKIMDNYMQFEPDYDPDLLMVIKRC